MEEKMERGRGWGRERGNIDMKIVIKSTVDMTWHDMTWHDMTWHDMTRHDITWGESTK